MKKFILVSLLVLLFPLSLFSKDKDDKGLIIYGNNFSFSVIEPDNWHCFTEDAAKYSLNAYFCYNNTNWQTSEAIIYISVSPKGNYSVSEHLKADMKRYSEKVKVEFIDFPINVFKYTFASKTYLYNELREYLCYVDPSKESPVYIIFVLSGRKDISIKHETTFINLINSFSWIASNVNFKK